MPARNRSLQPLPQPRVTPGFRRNGAQMLQAADAVDTAAAEPHGRAEAAAPFPRPRGRGPPDCADLLGCAPLEQGIFCYRVLTVWPPKRCAGGRQKRLWPRDLQVRWARLARVAQA